MSDRRNSDRRNDVWTKQPPTEPGWYWWRESLPMLGMIVLVSSGKVHSMFHHTPFAEAPELAGGEWFGPLQEPGGGSID